MKDRLAATAPARVVRRYLDAHGGTWAVVVAWNLLFAFFPIVLVAVTILGLVMRGQGIAGSIESQIQHAFPGGDGRSVVDALRAFRASAGPLAVVSFVGLMWSGSALFGAVEQALDALQPCPQRGFVRQRLMAFSMIVVFTVLIIVAVASSSLLSVVGRLPDVPVWLTTGPFGLLLQIAAGLLDGVLLFAVVYRLVPNRSQPLRSVMPGALTAAALFEAYTLLFPLYFRLEHGFSTYGSTFALFFLLLTYAYFMAQILVFGGAVNAELHPPAPGARPVPKAPASGAAEPPAVDVRGEPARRDRAVPG